MNVIDSYLDTLFAPYPDSSRMRQAKSELRAMMEEKQQGLIEDGRTETQAVGQVIAEFGSLEEVAPLLGISTELKHPHPVDTVPSGPRLELERARAYVEAVHRSQWLPATALPLFVLCAVPLLLLIAVTGGVSGGPTAWAVGIGITCVLVLVAAGVALLMVRDARLSDYEDIDEGEFTLTTPVRAYAQQVKREHRRSASVAGAVAVVLWILCALPTVLLALVARDGSPVPLYGVSLTLLMVALGLAITTRAGWSDTAAGELLQEDDKEESPQTSPNPAIRAVAAVYWPLVTAIYLGWSFISGAWGITWVVWPVAGVLYAGLFSLSNALRTDDEARPRAWVGRA